MTTAVEGKADRWTGRTGGWDAGIRLWSHLLRVRQRPTKINCLVGTDCGRDRGREGGREERGRRRIRKGQEKRRGKAPRLSEFVRERVSNCGKLGHQSLTFDPQANEAGDEAMASACSRMILYAPMGYRLRRLVTPYQRSL